MAMMVATGCMKDDTADVVVSGGKTEITAGISDTRTSLGELADGSRKVYWSEGDCIAVNGTASAALENVGEEASTAVFTFDGILTAPYSAVYPASIYTDASTVTLPSSQTHTGGSFGQNASPMAAYAADAAETPLQFHHLCAVVKLTITPDADLDKISYIEFRGNASEQVSGAFAIDYQTAALTPMSDAEADRSVRLNVNRNLSADAANEFFVVVPEGEYAQGFTVKVMDVCGHYMEKSTASAKTLVAGQINAMPAFAFVPTDTELGVEISSAEQLIAFAKAYNNREYADVSPLLVTLTDDIVFDDTTNADFVAIGNIFDDGTTNYFNGSFNGNGKSIKNWVVKSPLFDYVGGAGIVTDLTIDASCTFAFDLNDGSENYAPFVGYHKGLLENCHNNADIAIDNMSISEVINVGGLVGRCVEGTIDGCTMNGKMSFGTGFSSTEDLYVGGIVANMTNASGVVRSSALNGSIDWKGSVVDVYEEGSAVSSYKVLFLGGIAGRITGRIEYCTVSADGENVVINVVGENTSAFRTNVGGIVGIVEEGATVDNCTNNGYISAKMQRNDDSARYECLGGIVGVNNGVVSNSTNIGDIATRSAVKLINIGGIVGFGDSVNGVIDGCSNSGKLSAGTSGTSPYGGRYVRMGGICGQSNQTVSNISNSGAVEVSRVENSGSLTTLAVGGCIGYTSADIVGNHSIENTGTITTTLNVAGTLYTAFGGIVGETKASVSGVDNSGLISIAPRSSITNINVGGVVGRFAPGAPKTISDITNSGDIQISPNSMAYISNMNAGGVVGGVVSTAEVAVSDVENRGNVQFDYDEKKGEVPEHTDIRLGGVIGLSESTPLTIAKAMNYGRIYKYNNSANNAGRSIYTGGIAGCLTNGKISVVDCHNYGSLYNGHWNNTVGSTASVYVGGIVSCALGASETETIDITGCSNEIDVEDAIGIYAKRGYAGGIVGYAKYVKVDNCVNTTDFPTSNIAQYDGGIAAYLESSSVTGSVNTGMVYATLTRTPSSGGIAGCVDGMSSISASKSFATIGGAAGKVGGIAGSSVAGASISGCGFGGTLNGTAITETSQVCGDANGTFTDNYIWNGQE